MVQKENIRKGIKIGVKETGSLNVTYVRPEKKIGHMKTFESIKEPI
jgi:hypothetical protein